MSVREEDRHKTNPSRGLGLAAAAIGVGVGAALYYFFSKRPENPDSEGSTSQGWSCEQHTFDSLHNTSDADSYTTISEHSTSDTSMYTDEGSENIEIGNSYISDEESSQPDESDSSYHLDDSYHTTSSTPDLYSNNENSDTVENMGLYSNNENSDTVENMGLYSDNENSDTVENMDLYSNNENSDTIDNTETSWHSHPSIEPHSPFTLNSFELDLIRLTTDTSFESIANMLDWDVTESLTDLPSEELPEVSPLRMMFDYFAVLSPIREIRRTTEEEQMAILRDEAFRERSWSLEECSICFDVILKEQRVTSLPCTHNFHADCIAPWLREQRTCPNCRKAAE